MIHFDVENKEKELKELESKTTENDFWNDTDNSSKVLKQINSLKSKVEGFKKLNNELNNLLEMSELLQVEKDEELAKELLKSTYTLEKDIQDLYKDNTEIDKVTVTNEGKIVYITINFTKSIKVTTAEDLAIKSLDKVGEKNLTYYDVQYILTYSGTEENTNFPVFGSKSASSLKVVW